MKKTSPGYIILLILLCAVSSRLYAGSMFTGRMITVGPYGAQDTARNPALLSSQDQDNNIGVTAGYSQSAFETITSKNSRPSCRK
jgi:hypothetical protein